MCIRDRAVTGVAAAVTSSKGFLKNNPAALSSAVEKQGIKDIQSSSGVSRSEAQAIHRANSSNPNYMRSLENKVTGTWQIVVYQYNYNLTIKK